MRKTATLASIAVAFLLAGCTASGIAEFDREQTAVDRVDLPERYTGVLGFERDSMRWVAEDGGVEFYVARVTDGACVIMVKDGDVDKAMSACGGGEVGTSGQGFPHAKLYLDAPVSGPSHLKQLTPNLYVSE